jgi:2',3'-cyclic-nucleotide 2'-phosphodiesterase (5'-nucleotidase family)
MSVITVSKPHLLDAIGTPGKPAEHADTNAETFRLLYHNDFHQSWANLPKLVSAADLFRNTSPYPVIHVNTGDSVAGKNSARYYPWMLTVLNRLGLHAAVLGNHERDLPVGLLEKNIEQAKFPYLLSHSADNLPKGLQLSTQVTGQGQAPLGSVGIGLVGIGIDNHFKHLHETSPNDPRFNAFLDKAVHQTQVEIDKLHQTGVTRVVVLSHMGYGLDKQLAQRLDRISVIVGGDSHDLIKGVNPGENWVKGKSGQPVLIVQAGSMASHLGVADITFTPSEPNSATLVNHHSSNQLSHQLSHVRNRVIPVNTFADHPTIKQFLEQKLGKNDVVGTFSRDVDAENALDQQWMARWLTPIIARQSQADYAMVRMSEWKGSIKRGPMTRWALKSSFPMEENYAVVSMPVTHLFKHLPALEKAPVLLSRLRVQKDPLTQQPQAIWSHVQQRWLKGNDTITLAVNRFLVDVGSRYLPSDLFLPTFQVKNTSYTLLDLVTYALDHTPNPQRELSFLA